MKILNKEIDFSFTKADNIEKLENAVEVAQSRIKKIDSNEKMSVAIRKIYNIVTECFDSIFGENISKEIFEEKEEFKLCIKAFNDLLRAKNEQDIELDKEIKELQDSIDIAGSKYSANRATRRAK